MGICVLKQLTTSEAMPASPHVDVLLPGVFSPRWHRFLYISEHEFSSATYFEYRTQIQMFIMTFQATSYTTKLPTCNNLQRFLFSMLSWYSLNIVMDFTVMFLLIILCTLFLNFWMAIIQKTSSNKYWGSYGRKGLWTFICSYQGCKLVYLS